MQTKTLYWGSNESHEFWESEDRELMILRVHQEDAWTSHRHYGFLFASDTAQEAASRLNVVLSPDRIWERGERDAFRLVPTYPA